MWGFELVKRLMAIIAGIPIGLATVILISVPIVEEPLKLTFIFMGLALSGLGFGLLGMSTKLQNRT